MILYNSRVWALWKCSNQWPSAESLTEWVWASSVSLPVKDCQLFSKFWKPSLSFQHTLYDSITHLSIIRRYLNEGWFNPSCFLLIRINSSQFLLRPSFRFYLYWIAFWSPSQSAPFLLHYIVRICCKSRLAFSYALCHWLNPVSLGLPSLLSSLFSFLFVNSCRKYYLLHLAFNCRLCLI